MAKYRNYFDMNNLTIASYQSKVAELVNITKKLTQNQIIYLTPHSTNALKYNNKNDINTINKYNQNILKYCKKNNIYCFEPNIKDDKYYIDIVHFNSLGHIEMSNQLKKILKTQIKNYDLEKTLSNK